MDTHGVLVDNGRLVNTEYVKLPHKSLTPSAGLDYHVSHPSLLLNAVKLFDMERRNKRGFFDQVLCIVVLKDFRTLAGKAVMQDMGQVKWNLTWMIRGMGEA